MEAQHPVFKSVLLSGDEWLRLPVCVEGMHVPCTWPGSGLPTLFLSLSPPPMGAPTGATLSQQRWSHRKQ